MEIPHVIVFLGLLIFFSHVFNALFDKTKIPNVLLLLVIGIIIGPSTGIISKEYFGQFGSVFTTITLIVILFESGVNLRFAEIKKSIGSAFFITIINFIITLIITTIILKLFTDLNHLSCLFVGAIIGGTSSAVVIPMVKQLKIGNRSSTILFLESALSDVLCLIVGLALLDGMKMGALNIPEILNKMWKAFLFAAILGLVFGFAWSFLLNVMRNIKNSMFTSFAFVFILYGIVEMLNFNGGIAVLAFGILVGNSESISESKYYKKILRIDTADLNLNEKDFFSEIVFIVQTYFFVYVGISIQFGNIWIYLIGLLIVVLIIISRQLSIRLLSKKETNVKDVVFMSIMTPKGLIPAVLASIPLMLGLTDGGVIQDLGYSIVFLSILVCSVLVVIVSNDPLFFIKIARKKKNNNIDSANESGQKDVTNISKSIDP